MTRDGLAGAPAAQSHGRRMTSEEHYVETGHGRVYVEVEGDPAAELVLLATGGPGASHDHYHPWFSLLLPEYRVGYVDYIGCGLSDRLDDPTSYSIELLGANLAAICAHLETDTVSLVGISFGGFPAVHLPSKTGRGSAAWC